MDLDMAALDIKDKVHLTTRYSGQPAGLTGARVTGVHTGGLNIPTRLLQAIGRGEGWRRRVEEVVGVVQYGVKDKGEVKGFGKRRTGNGLGMRQGHSISPVP
ncbi:hypothetical protein M0802_010485 [Mischocyttarus mexicanus]|nr:hypothetical protein M0802_010485 [Mischocyttarus mexicanus]